MTVNKHNESGVALVLVLWLLALFTVMVGGYSATMRTETLLTAHQVQSARARALAEAGVWYGIRELSRPSTEDRWKLDGTPHTVKYGGGEFKVRLYDENGKIDLNTANDELLKNLLLTAGVSDNEASSLVQAILDWRDRDNLKRALGAEDDDYERRGLDYGAKDGPFNSVPELRLVMGMTEDTYRDISPALTVHSHQRSINPATAPKRALLALPQTNPELIDKYLASRTDDTEIDAILPGMSQQYVSISRGRTVTVSATGRVDDSTFTTETVVLLKPNNSPPFSILSWREAISGK